jgi:SAM-dependent methyltransferase
MIIKLFIQLFRVYSADIIVMERLQHPLNFLSIHTFVYSGKYTVLIVETPTRFSSLILPSIQTIVRGMELFEILKLLFFGTLLLICLVFLFFSFINGFLAAPFVPSSRKKTKKMVQEAELSKEDVVYDLGSGDGRIIIEAAKHQVKHAVGFEINPLLTYYARLRARLLKLDNTHFMTKTIWKADLTKCTRLFVYLMPKSMQKLQEKITKEMPEGSLIISNTFSFPDFEVYKTLEKNIKIYKVTR